MDHFSINVYNLIINLLGKQYQDKDIFQLKEKLKERQWLIKTKDDITNSNNDFKDKSITFTKKTKTDSLDLTFTNNKIHLFFYHMNTSKDPYNVTNAYIFGENISLNNIDKLKQCLQLVQ